uniref:Uncharacterized protein n=1 Tax=viral metagenome TaxID=1070528 RepID=A0A6M3L938_9ZZZZ
MKIQNVKLRGFIGIKKGMGLDEVSLDLSGVEGLIAMDGPNGMGKTSVLENLQPFRVLASRKKALQHHVFLRDSFRDLCFSFGGDNYRTLVKIDSDSEKQEGFIWRNGVSQVDGKVREYDRYLIELMGSSNLFFNSVFCAQGSGKISDMTTGELKSLFSEFLRLDLLEAYEDTAKQCFNVLGGIVGEIDGEILRLESTAQGLDDLQAKRSNLEADVKKVAGEISAAEAHVSLAEKNLKNAEVKVRENKILLVRIADHEKAVETIKATIAADKKETSGSLNALRLKAVELNAEIKSCEESLANADNIARAVTELQLSEDRLKDKTEDVEILTNQLSKISTAINDREKVHAALSVDMEKLQSDHEGETIAAQIESHKDMVSVLTLRPEECKVDSCVFIMKALNSRAEIPVLENKLQERRGVVLTKIDQLKKDLLEVGFDISRERMARSELEDKRAEFVKAIARLKSEILNLKGLAEKAPLVKIAEARLDDLRVRHVDIVAEGIQLRMSIDRKAIAQNERLEIAEATLADASQSLNHGIEYLISKHAAEIKELKNVIFRGNAAMNERGLDIHSVKIEISRKESAVEKLKTAQVRRGLVTGESSEWKYLKDACSKDGLRALEIDAVVPSLNFYANELLYHAYGGETVKLITQDEEGREILDIMIIDRDGEETLLSNRSGGEKVWPLKTIRLAMARMNNEKSGRDFRTLLADEEDGPLSLDNARRFVSLYRAIVTANQAGVKTFDDCFYITHKPECVAMADHVLRFTGEGMEVE